MLVMEALFTFLYPFVFVIGMAGYAPQLYKIYHEPACAKAMSLSTWSIWLSSWALSLGYGITVIQDMKFCIIAGMNVIAHFITISMIVYAQRDDLISRMGSLSLVRVRKPVTSTPNS